jgi:chemotaxis protein CheX
MYMKINAKHVNPFVEAAMKVINQITGIEVRRGHLSYKAKAAPSFGVSIIIGIYGFLTGQIVYSLDGNLAERLVDKLLEGKSPQQKSIMFLDSLGEVANMITGNATALLNQRQDQVLNITTPAIVAGDNLSIHLVPTPALVLGLITQYGPIEISISVEESETLSETEIIPNTLTEM